nr:EamA family transporter [Prevotella sp.]
MWRLIPFSILQCILLSSGQVFLKFALMKMPPFGWNKEFWISILYNWQFALCGICYGLGSILWMYILKNFPFSMAYPMISLSYVIGMFSAIIFFHEDVNAAKWIGVTLIIGGCFLIAK